MLAAFDRNDEEKSVPAFDPRTKKAGPLETDRLFGARLIWCRPQRSIS
jgi:hypothetical protein